MNKGENYKEYFNAYLCPNCDYAEIKRNMYKEMYQKGMIKTIWENYKKKEIEQVLKSRNENEAIGWVET